MNFSKLKYEYINDLNQQLQFFKPSNEHDATLNQFKGNTYSYDNYSKNGVDLETHLQHSGSLGDYYYIPDYQKALNKKYISPLILDQDNTTHLQGRQNYNDL